jgi:hypothetical protein
MCVLTAFLLLLIQYVTVDSNTRRANRLQYRILLGGDVKLG